jgi:uncharacterized membrane protein YcgQ (UPF0703/DUF1980 family)
MKILKKLSEYIIVHQMQLEYMVMIVVVLLKLVEVLEKHVEN